MWIFFAALLFIGSMAITTVEAFLVSWLMPHTGLNYAPDFFQAFVLCLIIDVFIIFGALVNSARD